MEVFVIILCWIVVPIVAAIVASNKGRSGAGWFFLCLSLTPLAILVLLALPTLKPPEPQFEPTAVLKGFPYRLRGNGTVDAMITGGLIHFHNMDLFRAAAEGRDAESVKAEFPDELHGYLYRVEKDGSVSAVDRLGGRVKFGDWPSFWKAAGRPETRGGDMAEEPADFIVSGNGIASPPSPGAADVGGALAAIREAAWPGLKSLKLTNFAKFVIALALGFFVVLIFMLWLR